MSGPRLRATLADLPRYRPGAAGGGAPAARLASNESPYQPLPGALDAAIRAASGSNRYPDHGCTGLVRALARRHRVPTGHVAVGTGSVALLHQLVQATSGPGDEVAFSWRSFEAYPIAAGLVGARGVPIPLRADERHDLPALAAAITDRTRLVLLCSPNNPTGTVIGRAELDGFLRSVPADLLVVLDEAYGEFVRDPRAARGLDFYRRYPNVCVLRTFSKAYGLAGMRVGYAIAREPVAEALRATAVPFGVSAMAQAAATASLEAEQALSERVGQLVAERTRMAAGLRRCGWDPLEGQANFLWLRLGTATEDFAAGCERRGVLVRPYPGDGVRITVGSVRENDRLLAVAADLR